MKNKDALADDPEEYKGDNDDTGQLNDIPQDDATSSQNDKDPAIQSEEKVEPYQGVSQHVTSHVSGPGASKKSMPRPFSSNPKKHPDPLLYSNYNRSSQRQNAWASSSKHVPKNILHDKEQLYEESLHLKQTMNILKEENTRLKTRSQQNEQELAQKDKEIKDLLGRINNPTMGIYAKEVQGKRVKTSAHLVMALKKKVQEIQKENKTLRDGLEALKKNIKLTSTQELDSELQTYAEECVRLRKVIEDMTGEKQYLTPEDVASIEEKIRQQNEVIAKLRKENKDLADRAKETEEEIKKWKVKAEDKKLSPSKESSQQTIIREQMKEIQKLKDQIESIKKSSKIQQQAENIQKAKVDLGKQKVEHEDAIRNLEMELVQCKRSKDAEIKALKDQINECTYMELITGVGDKEEQKQPEEEQKGADRIPILELNDVTLIALKLRMNLILAKIDAQDIKKVLFKNCDDDEKISVHEIARILKRGPISLESEEAIKIARYIVEPRTSKDIEYDELAEEQLTNVVEGLSLLVGEYTLNYHTQTEQVQVSLVDKLRTKIVPVAEALQALADSSGNVPGTAVGEINAKLDLQLSKDEADYILLTMYNKSKDVGKLPCVDLIEHLAELGCQVEEDDNPDSAEEKNASDERPKSEGRAEKGEEAEEEKEEAQEVQDEGSESKQPQKLIEDIAGEDIVPEDLNNLQKESQEEPHSEEKTGEAKPEEKSHESEREANVESMSEEQMIEIAQRCFSTIAEKMAREGQTIVSIFKDSIYKKTLDGEEVELISPADFMQGLQQLGLEELQPAEKGCLERMLAASDEERGFRVKDLVHILEDYGINEGTEDKGEDNGNDNGNDKGEDNVKDGSEEGVKEMKFEDLDRVSMVLLLALTEYLVSAKVSLYSLFGEAIYKQPAQVDDKEIEVEIVNSSDFFEVLHGIGIDTEEKEHDNLKNFMCIDPSYLDKFSVDKLKAAIEEFATNDELRAHAQQCYQELVDEEQLEQEPADDADKTGGKEYAYE